MEETVWIYIGVLSVIIAFGIIFTQFKEFREESKISKMEWSLAKFKSDWDFVCKAAIRTRVASTITIPSGVVFNTSTNRTCMNLDGEVRCELLDCSIHEKEYVLDLNQTMLSREVPFMDYECLIQRIGENATLECQG